MRYARSIRRFAQGTPSIPALYSALPGLQIIEEVGIENIAHESRRRTEWMIQFALEQGWKVNTPRNVAERGGSVMIGAGRGPQRGNADGVLDDGPEMVARLAERRVFVDCRPGVGLRISPHFFNTDDEVSQAMEILEELMN
jgi:kynureninase